MDPDLREHDRGTVLRQRLQITGAVIGVIIIWTLALWPSNGQQAESRARPRPSPSATSWTTGAFVGTALSSTGTTATHTVQTSAPTRTSGPAAQSAPSPSPAAVARTTAPPVTTSTPTTSPSWTPPGQAKKPTRPPKALDILDVITL